MHSVQVTAKVGRCESANEWELALMLTMESHAKFWLPSNKLNVEAIEQNTMGPLDIY